jgi:hypothetical protein
MGTLGRGQRVGTMPRQPVDSSMLASVGYDAATRTLELEFNSGHVWQYFEVPEKVYRQLMASSSHGGYARDLIIDVYRDRRIR